ncbi:hypothetical protein SS50377_24552 [Spironucleus salmonicida]|uniref:Uncharacterized protein n=1 Tax=Spironucleus salmonicida TaxID=348837 RepID=V6LQC0_9EUKA|nr:hypothetical protein SS50377_24552 [Spironucleus salmonicida]|eukprot:EST45906.1 hypothetical protein SS50377_13882 [Spironucleus salmonicida]
MDIAAFRNIILLQNPNLPLDTLYNLKFTPDFLIRGPTAQRLLIIHFLLSQLDVERSKIAFQHSITSKNQSRITLTDPVKFRQISHLWLSEIQNQAKFEVPGVSDLCSGNAKNLKLLYQLSKFVLRIKSQQIIRELELTQNSPFHSLNQNFTSDSYDATILTLKTELNSSSEEFEILLKISDKMNQKMADLHRNGTTFIEINEEELHLKPELAGAISKIQQFYNFNELDLTRQQTETVNLNELLHLSQLYKRNSQQINLSDVFNGQLIVANEVISKLQNDSKSSLNIDFKNQIFYQKMGEIGALISQKIIILQAKVDEILPEKSLIQSQFMKKDNVLNLQHFSVLSDFTETARNQLSEMNIHNIIDMNSQNCDTSVFEDNELRFSMMKSVAVIEHTPDDMNNLGMSRTKSQFLTVKDLKNGKSEGTLASRLKRTVGGEYGMETFVAGKVEGVREFLRAE